MFRNINKQDSPPAWPQEAYRPRPPTLCRHFVSPFCVAIFVSPFFVSPFSPPKKKKKKKIQKKKKCKKKKKKKKKIQKKKCLKKILKFFSGGGGAAPPPRKYWTLGPPPPPRLVDKTITIHYNLNFTDGKGYWQKLEESHYNKVFYEKQICQIVFSDLKEFFL